jgi:hypothetical protein
MTDHRRQVRRSQIKTWRWGCIKKSDLRVEANHHRQLAYNRYGVISVSFTYQQQALAAESWEDRLALTPLRAFTLRSLVERVGEERDQPLPATLGLLQNSAYLAEPFAVLDRSAALERLQSQRRQPEAAALLGQLPALELLNRCGYYQYRLEERRRRLQRGSNHLPLLRARPVLHTPTQGYSPRYRTPLERANLAALPSLLQRKSQQRRQRREGQPWQGAQLGVSPRSWAENQDRRGTAQTLHPKLPPRLTTQRTLPRPHHHPLGLRGSAKGRSGRHNRVTAPWLRLRRSSQLQSWETSADRLPRRPI